MGENPVATVPSALYGLVLLMAALAYWMLQHLIIASQGHESLLKRALGRDWKGKGSLLLYLIAMVVAFRSPGMAQGCYVVVAWWWLIPDRRIERALSHPAT